MSTFNIHRFASVARWDLTLNRSFYIKMGLVIFLSAALPAFLFFVINWALWQSGIVSYEAYEPFPVANNFLCVILNLIIPCLVGFTFHNLSSRQGRVMELMLPASNVEKYLWHAVLAVFGSLLMAVLSLAIIDAMQALMTFVAFGSEHINSYFKAIYENITTMGGLQINQTPQTMSPYGAYPAPYLYGDSLAGMAADSLGYGTSAMDSLDYYYGAGQGVSMTSNLGGGTMSFSGSGMPPEIEELISMVPWYASLLSMVYVTYLSTYVLGNSILYRFNIIFTILFHFIFGFVLFVAVFAFLLMFGGNDTVMDIFKWFVAEKAGIVTSMALLVLLSVAIWYVAFALYKKAQITSPMNR